MSPVTTANPSPTPPATAGAVVPVPVGNLLDFRLASFIEILSLWRFEFIKDAGSRAWNTGHCVDWADSACKRSCSGNAKHRSQESSPIHSKPPRLHELKPSHCENRGPASRGSGLAGPISTGRDIAVPIHHMSAEDYAHHQKGDGCRENRCEQPACLANTFIHVLSPNLDQQLRRT